MKQNHTILGRIKALGLMKMKGYREGSTIIHRLIMDRGVAVCTPTLIGQDGDVEEIIKCSLKEIIIEKKKIMTEKGFA